MGKFCVKIDVTIVKRLLLLLITFLFITSEVAPKNRDDSIGVNEYSARNIFGFTKSLILEKEYYRAGMELKRLKSFYPDYISILNYSVTENYLLFCSGQFNNIINKEYQFDNSIYNNAGLLFKTDAFLYKEQYDSTDNIISSWDFGRNSIFDNYFYKRKILTFMMMNRFDSIDDFHNKYRGNDYSEYLELKKYAKNQYDKMKTPSIAVALGFVPGMGYIYSERRNTGLMAFFVITINAALTYFAFTTNNEAIGIFIGAIGTFFYTGSIVGGYMATKDHNEHIMKNMRDDLMDKMLFEQDRENIFNNHGIGK